MSKGGQEYTRRRLTRPLGGLLAATSNPSFYPINLFSLIYSWTIHILYITLIIGESLTSRIGKM